MHANFDSWILFDDEELIISIFGVEVGVACMWILMTCLIIWICNRLILSVAEWTLVHTDICIRLFEINCLEGLYFCHYPLSACHGLI